MYINKCSVSWKLLLFWMVVMLSIASCGGKEDAQVEGSNSNENNVPSQSIPQDQNISNPIIHTNPSNQEIVGFAPLEDTDDWLLYVEGASLYLARFDGSEPSLIAEDVNPPTVTLSPDNSHVAFTSGERRHTLSLVDLETLNLIGTIRLPTRFGFMGPWSPDGEWMILFNFPAASLVSTDTSENYRIGTIQNAGFAQFWLQDSTLLIFETPANSTDTTLRRLDPTTREEIEIDEVARQDIILAFNNQPDLAGTIAFQETVSTALGIDLATPTVLDPDAPPNINIIAPPANTQGIPDRCGTFELQQQFLDLDTQPIPLVSIEESVFISNQILLEDGTVLFLRWYFENCDSVTMRATLMRIDPDGNLDVIINDIDPGTSPNLSFFFADTGNRVSVSSDQNYVAWLGGGLGTGEATLNVTRLDTLETIVLLHNEENVSNSSTFYLDSVFNSVNWLPR